MMQISYELIFEEKDIFLQDSKGRRIETFQKSDFLTGGGWYNVTEPLVNRFSKRLVIKINAPIEVYLNFKAEINANVKGATANACARGAIANANVKGTMANACASDAIANANKAGSIANANDGDATANANVSGATANANDRDAIANAYVSGATANANAKGAIVKYFY